MKYLSLEQLREYQLQERYEDEHTINYELVSCRSDSCFIELDYKARKVSVVINHIEDGGQTFIPFDTIDNAVKALYVFQAYYQTVVAENFKMM